MSLSEDRVLASIEYNLISNTINVAWKDRILKDGVVINENFHRGAYPVDEDGNVDSAVVTLLGKGLKDYLGDASADALRNSISLQDEINILQQDNEQLTNNLNTTIINSNHEINNLKSLNSQHLSENASLVERIKLLETENDSLDAQVKALNKRIESL